MPLSFPGSPSVNDTYTVGQRTWTWDGSIWSLSADTIGSASVTSSEIASSAVTTAKIADANVTAAKIASDAVTTAKILDANVTTGKVAANAITQAKLASNLSAVTVTTTANRDTDIASPFTGQLAILTDTKKIQLYDGTSWVNVSLAPPETPTSLSATALSTTSVSIAFTAGGANGSPITNYKYALSTNGGSTYGSFTALSPEDITTPITISGLTAATAYYFKLKAVNDMGDSVASASVSVSTLSTPQAPTSLSATPATTSVAISFTPGSNNGYAITNYQYALSTDSGSTYGSFTALDPADATSPITISGLTHSTAYYIKLKGVNSDGAGDASSAVSFTTGVLADISYLVVAGGGAGGSCGGGAGGLRSTVTNTGGGGALQSAISTPLNTNLAISIGGGGTHSGGYVKGTNGNASSFSSVTTVGGGSGGHYYTAAPDVNPGSVAAVSGSNGGSGGGAQGAYSQYQAVVGQGTANEGFAGGLGNSDLASYTTGGGGGGAGQAGQTNLNVQYAGANGGNGVLVEITGSSIYYAGGGGSGGQNAQYIHGTGGYGGGGGGGSGTGAGAAGTANLGGGGGGCGSYGTTGGAGGSGVVILRYSSARTITVGAGLTASHTNEVIAGGYKYTRITAGTGNVSWA